MMCDVVAAKPHAEAGTVAEAQAAVEVEAAAEEQAER